MKTSHQIAIEKMAESKQIMFGRPEEMMAFVQKNKDRVGARIKNDLAALYLAEEFADAMVQVHVVAPQQNLKNVFRNSLVNFLCVFEEVMKEYEGQFNKNAPTA